MENLKEHLLTIELFTPVGAATELVSQLEEAVREIDSYRPLPQDVVQKINEDVFYDRVYSSAVTEGNRLSRRETIVVLTTGIIEAGYRKDRLEVRNLAAAIVALQEALDDNVPLNPHLLRNLHHLLLQDIDDSSAGSYRMENVAITGAAVNPPQHSDVQDFVNGVLSLPALEDESYPAVQRAAWLHWAISRIHPFKDGNGRVARLAQDYVLLRNHHVPSTIQSEDRESAYYDALEAADLGNGVPFLELVAKNTLKMADRYLSIIRARDAKEDWLSQITKVATEKVRQTAHRRFLVLQRTLNLLKNEFYQLSSDLYGRIPTLDIDFRDYGSLRFEQYQDIETKGGTKDAWQFSIKFSIQETALRYVFWVGTHRWRPYDITTDLPSKLVVLISSEEEERYFRMLDELREDRITLRELVPSGTQYWRRRYDPVKEKDEWDTDISVDKIAQDFFQEVLAKLGLI